MKILTFIFNSATKYAINMKYEKTVGSKIMNSASFACFKATQQI